MTQPRRKPGLGGLALLFGWGAVWGAAGAVLEAKLLAAWLHVELQQPLATTELIINYMCYAGLATVVLRVLIGAVRKQQAAPARLSEALVGTGVVVFGLANYFHAGPWGPLNLRSGLSLVYLVGAGLVVAGATWVILRLRCSWLGVVRGALIVWVIAGVLWEPLTGRYTGVFRGRGEKAGAGSFRNVLLIITDTLRSDFLDCYGATWRASPSADRMAEAGVLFEDHLVQSTWTLPSTSTILTGVFPSSHGAVATGLPVSSTAPMLAAVLNQSGYRTAAFTENTHILPRNGFGRGFDDFWAYWLPWIYDDTLLYRFGTRLHVPFVELTGKQAFPHPVTRPDQVNWDAAATTDQAIAWLGRDDGAPFFAYVHYMGPHGPYGPPEYMLDRAKPPVDVTDHPRPMGGAWPLGEAAAKASEADIDVMRVLYAADILYVEHHIGRILDWLDRQGKLDETLVVFTSDHGEEFFEHHAWNHGSSAFTEQLRVPLIMMAPGLIEAGRRVAQPTRHVDVVPTVLDLVGIECPGDVQGRSLRALIDGGELPPVPVYTEVHPLRPSGSAIVSIVDGEYKLIRVTLGERTATMLFDLTTDPSERINLAGGKPNVADSLDAEMVTWDRVAHLLSPDSGEVPIDSRRLKMLKSLGYIK